MLRNELNRRGVLQFAVGASFAGLAVLTGCERAGGPQSTRTIRLRQEWFPFAGYAGEVLAAARYAAALGINLQVVPGGETIDPIRTVLARQDDIGVVSGDLLIKAVAGGAPLVAIGVVNDISPTCFIAKRDSNIATVADFVGKRIGILRGTNTERIYSVMMRRNGIERSRVTEVDAPFDLNTFILGQYDVRPAFVYDEPVTLGRANIPITILRPADYGVRFVGTVYFTRRELLESRRADLVAALQALVSGWREAAQPAGQAAAIAALKRQFPDIDQAKETESLRLGASLFLGPQGSGRPLTVTPEHLRNTVDGLLELHELRADLPIDRFWTDALLNEAYEKLHT
jgi:ABC-type nitrate/sulfonate/bicarbonate transport system substrate-binding protein